MLAIVADTQAAAKSPLKLLVNPASTQPIGNFGRNVTFRPQNCFAPRTLAELLTILDQQRGRQIRAVGRLHSWSEAMVADEVLIDVQHLNEVRVERVGDEVWANVGAGCQIKQLLSELDRQAGVTLPTLGLISEQTIAGATATATHGSGRSSMSHYLAEVHVATYDANGQPVIRIIDSGDELRAARCSLGCLGIVTAVKLRCRPEYSIEEHQRRYAKLEDLLAAEEEFPLTQFYLFPWSWMWIAQHRREVDAPRSWLAGLYRVYWFCLIDVGLHLVFLLLARILRSPLLIRSFFYWLLPLLVTKNWRVVDRSQAMLIMEHELFWHIESELFVGRSQLPAATDYLKQVLRHCAGQRAAISLETRQRLQSIGRLQELLSLAGTYTHHYAICIRKVLPDDTLLSMTSGRDEPSYSISLISYAKLDDREGFLNCTRFLAQTMAEMFQARPHWGKLCPLDAGQIRELYPQVDRFVEICRANDPAGVFRNRWLTKLLFGDEAVTQAASETESAARS